MGSFTAKGTLQVWVYLKNGALIVRCLLGTECCTVMASLRVVVSVQNARISPLLVWLREVSRCGIYANQIFCIDLLVRAPAACLLWFSVSETDFEMQGGNGTESYVLRSATFSTDNVTFENHELPVLRIVPLAAPAQVTCCLLVLLTESN